MRTATLCLIALAFGCAPHVGWAQTSANNQRLKQALKRFPDADANKDGVLTLDEAKAYRNKRKGGQKKAKRTDVASTNPEFAERKTEGPGYNCLFMGHSFFIPVARTFEAFPAQYGVPNHQQKMIMHGGGNGAPGKLWMQRRQEAESILKTGQVDVLGMTYYPTNSEFEDYKNWVDLARKYNPKTKFFVGLPWMTNGGQISIDEYAKRSDASDAKLRAIVARLRKAYPDNEFLYAEYGHASTILKRKVEAGEIPEITKLLGRGTEFLYRDPVGHANPAVWHFAALVWTRTLYNVDLQKTRIDSPITMDLRKYATDIAARE